MFSLADHRRPALRRAPLAVALLAVFALPAPAMAQGVSQEVVQPLPPDGVDDLDAALRRLALNSRDVDALIDAGNAALKLGDLDGAIGFFGRADDLSPGNAKVKLGLAAAFVRSERPIEALTLFNEAEAAGASSVTVDAERGLAYDLVGDNASAQTHYRHALATREDAETRRRLALSLAISGDRAGFEDTLLPLLKQGDRAAFRTRAFGLAVLGQQDEAVRIADQSMPKQLATRIAPYLRYMPRLTRAQQAAAGNLGKFPRASQIGRDDPRIAAYSGSAAAPAPARGVDSRLAPAGEPLGPRSDGKSGRRRPGRASSAVEKVEVARAETASPAAPAAETPPAEAPKPSVAIARTAQDKGPERVMAQKPPEKAAELPPVTPPQAEPVAQAAPVPQQANTPAPTRVAGNFDLGTTAGADTPAAASTPPPAPAPAEQKPAPQQEEPASVAEAFSGFTTAPARPAPAAKGAVDITKIKPPREKPAPPPPPKPEKPKEPSRIWVQVATGKNIKALGFDWRRISRKAPKQLGKRDAFTTPWGQANRLLTGPFDSAKAARDMVTELKKEGIDSFTFTSAEGQEVKPLG